MYSLHSINEVIFIFFSAGYSWIRLPCHKQRLHSVSPWLTTSGTDKLSLIIISIDFKRCILNILYACVYSIKRERNSNQNPTITVLICQKWSGKTQKKRQVPCSGSEEKRNSSVFRSYCWELIPWTGSKKNQTCFVNCVVFYIVAAVSNGERRNREVVPGCEDVSG